MGNYVEPSPTPVQPQSTPVQPSPTYVPDEPKQIPQDASLIPEAPYTQVNASSTYQSYYLAKNAFDINKATRWESDMVLYNSSSGELYKNIPTSCLYAPLLKIFSYDYPYFNSPVENNGEWLEIKFDGIARISGYAITANFNSIFAPSSWKLLVSSDRQTWYGIHQVENENRWATAKDQTIYYELPYELVNVNLPPFFRIVVTNVKGYVQINEVRFHGEIIQNSTFITRIIDFNFYRLQPQRSTNRHELTCRRPALYDEYSSSLGVQPHADAQRQRDQEYPV